MGDLFKNFGMIIPTEAIKIKKHRTLFGWTCLKMKRWVGIKYYKRITPVRQDLIFDFLFWKFVKSLNKTNYKWTNNSDGSKTWEFIK